MLARGVIFAAISEVLANITSGSTINHPEYLDRGSVSFVCAAC
jgi:hypothetical protein